MRHPLDFPNFNSSIYPAKPNLPWFLMDVRASSLIYWSLIHPWPWRLLSSKPHVSDSLFRAGSKLNFAMKRFLPLPISGKQPLTFPVSILGSVTHTVFTIFRLKLQSDFVGLVDTCLKRRILFFLPVGLPMSSFEDSRCLTNMCVFEGKNCYK